MLETLAAAFAAQCSLWTRFGRDQSGNYAVLTALTTPVLLGIAGLGTEVGVWSVKHQTMQSAADSGAVSAAVAYYIQGNNSNLSVQANAVASPYGFVNGSNGVTVTVNQPPKSGTHTTTAGAVEVIITQPQTRLFSAMWDSQSMTLSARAVAIPASSWGGTGCVAALSGSASGAIGTQGNAQIGLDNCSMFDNSSNASALTAGGTSAISAYSVNVVGQVPSASAANISVTNGIQTGGPPMIDPYGNTSPGSFSGCDQHNYSAKTTVTISPGVYCGGINLNAGANVTLSPGIYYLDQGNLQVNGGATMTGTGVTLVFTSSTGHNYANATIGGGATINLTAPTTGATAGIAIFGDRNMPAGTTFKFEGGASQIFGGALYLPKAAVSFSGGAGTSTGCTQLIANTVTFTGTSNFAIDCSGYGTKPFGFGLALLVE
jgi:Flp pilus assembly protein TadG